MIMNRNRHYICQSGEEFSSLRCMLRLLLECQEPWQKGQNYLLWNKELSRRVKEGSNRTHALCRKNIPRLNSVESASHGA